MKKIAFLLLGILLFSACSSIKVTSDYDTQVDFSKYKTFAFYKTGIDKAEISDLDKKRILRAIESELLAQGFTKSENPDMLVSIFTKSRERVNVSQNNLGWGWGWGWNPSGSNGNRNTTPRRPRVVRAQSSGGSSVSGLTTPSRSSRVQRQQENRVHAATAGLLQLGGGSPPATPQRNQGQSEMSAMREEDLMESNLFGRLPTEFSDDEAAEDDFDDDALPEVEREMASLSVAIDNEVQRGFQDESNNNERPVMYGAPAGWKPPSAPDDFAPDPPKRNKGEPTTFDTVDNPGQWSQFTYRPKFGGDRGCGDYLYHCLPTGITPVPANANGKRIVEQLITKGKGNRAKKEKIGEFEFHYRGWKRSDNEGPFRSGATRDNLFPDERKGKLCRSALIKLGCTPARMKQADGAPDSLFFYQLLLPICQTENSGVMGGDPRIGFYHKAARWSNTYAVRDLDIGNGLKHKYENVTMDELLRWDGVIVMDGALGGSRGAIFRRFDDSRDDNVCFNQHIASAFTKTRFMEIKRVYKLCDNEAVPKRGQPAYNPAYKYDYIYHCIVHNTTAITERAALDLCADESTYPYMGFGPGDGSQLVARQRRKKCSKGGQIILATDVDRVRPRAYLHRHRLHNFEWSNQGASEVKLIWDQLKHHVVGTPADENLNPTSFIQNQSSHKNHT